MGKAPCCDKTKVKRGLWSPEEDTILENYVQKYGTGGNWIALPQKAGLKRCGKSCRLRWLNYLRPDIKRGDFTQEEDNIIFTLYQDIGSRWSVIASRLPGRTDNDVKNYWNTKLRKKLLVAGGRNKPAIATTSNTNNSIGSTDNLSLLAPSPSTPIHTIYCREVNSSVKVCPPDDMMMIQYYQEMVANDEIPLPGLIMGAPENREMSYNCGLNYHPAPPLMSQESFSSLSPVSFSLEKDGGASWYNNGSCDTDMFLQEYDLRNSFRYHETFTDEIKYSKFAHVTEYQQSLI